jgi:hypothetical protein
MSAATGWRRVQWKAPVVGLNFLTGYPGIPPAHPGIFRIWIACFLHDLQPVNKNKNESDDGDGNSA